MEAKLQEHNTKIIEYEEKLEEQNVKIMEQKITIEALKMILDKQERQLSSEIRNMHHFEQKLEGLSNPNCNQDSNLSIEKSFDLNKTIHEIKMVYQNMQDMNETIIDFKSDLKSFQSNLTSNPTQNVFNAWSEWSQCSVSCGSGGVQSRQRSCVTNSICNGKPIIEESRSCNDIQCESKFNQIFQKSILISIIVTIRL